MKVIKLLMFLVLVSIMFTGCMLWDIEEVRGKGKNGGDVSIPVITITTQPVAETNVMFDNISGSLSIVADVSNDAVLNYRWYNNTANTNTSGIAIENATSAGFTIPLDLDEGTYYYFCEISAFGAVTIRSNVAMVRVTQTGVIEMVWVYGGSFELGRNLGTGGGSDVTPVSTVTLTGFLIGKYQVTQEQWIEMMGEDSNPSWYKTEVDRPPMTGEVDLRRPVERVSWYDVIVFCNILSMKEGLIPAYEMQTFANTSVWNTDPSTWGTVPANNDDRWDAVRILAGSTGYRLPTEAQWEYAAKGGNGSPGSFTYSGSNNVNDVAWYTENSDTGQSYGQGTHEVGKKSPNGLGIYDMSGNVWEWCWDWWVSYTATAKTDPVGPSAPVSPYPWLNFRVFRGGGWSGSVGYVRSVNRDGVEPNKESRAVGFRLVRP